ncbi:MAG: prolipoprotein diacylglyceryl transferase [bacterium]|nr:prolipoprotein diacylglyceryl transferase [bacterium]
MTSRNSGGPHRNRRSLLRMVPTDLAWAALFLVVFSVLVARNYFLDHPSAGGLQMGKLRLTPFGSLIALDLLFGFYLVKRWCTRFDLDWSTLSGGLPWIAGLGYFISHLVSIAAYFPQDLTNPIALLDFRSGISSFGGFFGGAAVAIVFLKWRRLDVWRYSDALVYGFVGGYIFGRLGCFAMHDHPGVKTDFFLAVDIKGVARHDLGLYEMFLMIALFTLLHLSAREGRPSPGTAVAVTVLVYAPVRFLFDFLRIDDVLYYGLTPGQWFSLPLFAIGIWAFAVSRAGARSQA